MCCSAMKRIHTRTWALFLSLVLAAVGSADSTGDKPPLAPFKRTPESRLKTLSFAGCIVWNGGGPGVCRSSMLVGLIRQPCALPLGGNTWEAARSKMGMTAKHGRRGGSRGGSTPSEGNNSLIRAKDAGGSLRTELKSNLQTPLKLFGNMSLPGYDTTYEIIKAADEDAPVVKKGCTVTVHATGIVKETGKIFWSTKDPGQQPFEYRAGVRSVITGWDQGCLGMQKGEIRKLLIPAKEGYGAGGFPEWGIPPNGSLDFQIEVLQIK